MKFRGLQIALLLSIAPGASAQTYPQLFTKFSKSTTGFPSTISPGAQFGILVSGIGDLDKDGIPDMAVGATVANGGQGSAYIHFMNALGSIKSSIQLPLPSGAEGYGSSVCGLGDMDGDGVLDVGIGEQYDNDGGFQRGAFWIHFMNTNGTIKSSQKISNLQGNFTAPLNDVANFGTGATNLGDLDNDGVIDLAIGAHQGTDLGSVYIVFMKPNGTVKGYHQIVNGTAGINVNPGEYFGYAVEKIGDLDGDGVVDLAVGAHHSDSNLGSVWILYLTSSGNVKSTVKISPAAGTFNQPGATRIGVSIAGIGDYNGDGIPDLVIAGDDGSGKGTIWYTMMRRNGTISSYYKIGGNLTNTNIVLKSGDFFGISLGNLGDVNQDGVRDIVVGASLDDDGGTDTGAVYISVGCTLKSNAGTDLVVCIGATVTMTATAPSLGTGAWSVIQGSGTFSNIQSPTSMVTNLGTANKFKWTVSYPGCVTGSDTVAVTTYPLIAVIPLDSIRSCMSPIIIQALVPSNGTGTWTTTNTNVQISTPNQPTTSLSFSSYPILADFTWTVASPGCTPASDKIRVRADKLYADIPSDSILSCATFFPIEAKPPLAGNGLWSSDNPDINISDPANNKTGISIPSGTSGNIFWTVSSSGCQSVSDTLRIKGINLYEEDIPNVITPNVDGKNDFWKIEKLSYLPPANILIINRWGESVYRTDKYLNNWNGSGLSPGIYFYSLQIQGCKQIFKGSVSLLH